MVSNDKRPLLLLFPEYREPGIRLSKATSLPYTTVKIHHFPDGESRIELPDHLPKQVILCQTLDHPNEKLVELMLTAKTARRLGASHLTLVAPYLCYMRQDKAFHPGESISQVIIGHFLKDYFNVVITVDPHLHRVQTIQQAVPAQQSFALSATLPIAQYIKEHIPSPFIIGPDSESEQWVASIAKPQGYDYAVAHKQRTGDSEVEVTLPDVNLEHRHVLLLDDIASTGRTLISAATKITTHNPASITAIVTHALFLKCVISEMQAAGIKEIISTDSILHESNKIHLDQIMAEAIHHVYAHTLNN
jgi:ribose-phosphate pyrophosphokinase